MQERPHNQKARLDCYAALKGVSTTEDYETDRTRVETKRVHLTEVKLVLLAPIQESLLALKSRSSNSSTIHHGERHSLCYFLLLLIFLLLLLLLGVRLELLLRCQSPRVPSRTRQMILQRMKLPAKAGVEGLHFSEYTSLFHSGPICCSSMAPRSEGGHPC